MYVKSDEIFEISLRYDEHCIDYLPAQGLNQTQNPEKCYIDIHDFDDYEELPKQLYIYYELTNFH